MKIEAPQIVLAEKQARVGDREMTNIVVYQPPIDGDADQFAAFDQWIAMRCMSILTDNFPGYPWDVVCDSRQGVIHFGIRVLMGQTLRWVIKLAQWSDMQPKLVRDGGGQLLERFNLPRTGFEVVSFLKARDHKHLAQIDFKRPA